MAGTPSIKARLGARLGKLLGKEDAKALVTIIVNEGGSPSPRLRMKLDSLLGSANAAALCAIPGTATAVQPKLTRALYGLLGTDAASALIVQLQND